MVDDASGMSDGHISDSAGDTMSGALGGDRMSDGASGSASSAK